MTQAPAFSLEGASIASLSTEPRRSRATAASTRSAIRGGSSSGHLSTAWYEMPTALAADTVVPPSSSMALDLSIRPLNHSSKWNATEVQTSGGKVPTVVHEYKDRLAAAMKGAKVSTADFARDLGLSYQAVKKVLNGGQFGMENNLKAAKRLGVRSEWLATGKGLMTEPPAIQQRPELKEIADEFAKLTEPQIRWAMRGIRYALEAAPRVKDEPDAGAAANTTRPDADEMMEMPSSRRVR